MAHCRVKSRHVSASPAGIPLTTDRFFSNRFERSVHVFARKWSRRTMSIAAGCAVVVVALAAFLLHSRTADAARQVPFSDLLGHLDRGEVAAVVISGDTLEFTLSNA